MTDYAAPTTADQALDEYAKQLEYRREQYRREAKILLARADEVEDIRLTIGHEAYRYREYQPKPDPAPADQDPVELATHGLLNAARRIHERWEDSEQRTRGELLQGLHKSADALRDAIEVQGPS